MIKKKHSIECVETFGSRLRQARLRLNWTQKKLAEASGLSQSAIGNYESGQRSSSRALLRLAEALNVDPQWLDRGEPTYQRTRPNTSMPPAPHTTFSEPVPSSWPMTPSQRHYYQLLSARDQRVLSRLIDNFIHNCLDSYQKSE